MIKAHTSARDGVSHIFWVIPANRSLMILDKAVSALVFEPMMLEDSQPRASMNIIARSRVYPAVIKPKPIINNPFQYHCCPKQIRRASHCALTN